MSGLLTISFTGARELDRRGCGVILNVLAALPAAGRYVTGGCTGGDAFIGRHLAESRPEAQHAVIVPADKSRVDPWWLTVEAGVELILMPGGSTYRHRNARLVAEGTFICGFPAYPESDPWSLRSGTWQTIRMARQAGKLCRWDCIRPPFKGCVEKWPNEFEVRRIKSDD